MNTPSQRQLCGGHSCTDSFRVAGHCLALLLCLLVAQMGFSGRALSNSVWFSVDITSIEAMMIDRGTGKFSEDIVGSDSFVFVSSGGLNQTRTKSADDVFLKVGFKAKGDGNVQPPITLVVLEHFDAVEGPGVRIVHWQNNAGYPDIFDSQDRGTMTALLKGVTCSKLDVVVKVGDDETAR